MKPYLKQRIRTMNDANGNPRRLWLGYSASGEVLQVFDEGYSGDPWPTCQRALPEIDAPPAEYRRLKRRYATVLVES